VFSLSLSDLAAVRIHHHRVFPAKSAKVRDIEEVIENLQRLMKGTPPLWLLARPRSQPRPARKGGAAPFKRNDRMKFAMPRDEGA
jgi:hypothetical protein